MRTLAQRALVWRLLAALLAVALVFSAPVTHAAPQTCLDGHHQMVDGDPGDATSKLHHSPEQNCCSVICVFCLAVAAQPAGSVQSVLLLARVLDIADDVAGHDPSPGLEPPRSFG
jgi:hypothetical protein